MNIKEQLLQGKPFSGRNGAFTGRPQSIEGDTLIVICDKDGMKVGNFNILSGVLNVVIIISYE